ncbi:hypothetical protein HDU98_008799 [Podochytrium sp. JEL0797]|nr:hypothetical protein HDU98_008799 [Podochytrium sp. JEL0797]
MPPPARTLASLHRLTRQYLQCTPMISFNFGPLCNNLTSEIQTHIIAATAHHPIALKFPPPRSYTAKFLKQFIARIEAQKPVGEDDTIGYIMSKVDNDSGLAYRSYSMNNDSEADTATFVTLSETPHKISNGTTRLRTWPAALSLVSYLISQKGECIPAKKVVELGCGVGLGGISCGVLGVASAVEFTDVDPIVLETVSKNCNINFGEQWNGASGHSVDFKVKPLDWEAISDSDLVNHVNSTAANLIVASDVAYDPVISTWEHFLSELKRHGLAFEKLDSPDLGLYYFDEPSSADLLSIYKA